MRPTRYKVWVGLVLAALSLTIPVSAPRAENYPSRPIRVIVPAPPGGVSDIFARKLAAKLREDLKQPIVIDNRPGAGGNIAAELVAKAKTDGYTVLYGHVGMMCINPWLYSSLTYDPAKDLVPVIQVTRQPAIVVVNSDVPARSLADLIALARAKRGQFTYGSGGFGSPQHVTGELFKVLTGVNMIHVPYKGSAPVMAALLTKEIHVGFEYPAVVAPQLRAGHIRALAIAAPKRLAALPNVPTAAEAGLQGFESESWGGYFVPAGTPSEVIALLHREIAKVVLSPQYVQFAKRLGSEVVALGPDAFAEFVRVERGKWGEVVKASGAHLE